MTVPVKGDRLDTTDLDYVGTRLITPSGGLPRITCPARSPPPLRSVTPRSRLAAHCCSGPTYAFSSGRERPSSS
jgi:hypothetical protein